MARLRLAKLVRGAPGDLVRDVIATASGDVAVVDAAGRVLAGTDPGESAPRFPIDAEGEALGEVRGAGGALVARLVGHLVDRELEKVQLANETLGRYKELTLLYEMSDRLSRILDVEEVARSVVEEARRAVDGHTASLFLHDRRRDALVALATTDARATASGVLPAGSGVEGRVLRTGHAEFVESVDTEIRVTLDAPITSMICAPLRAGERVVGVLRVTDTRPAAWTAGDLKLVTSLAAQAAAALQGAELHLNRMREVALKHHLERYVSPLLVDAALDGVAEPDGDHLALLFCDVRLAATAGAAPDEVVRALEARMTRAVDALLAHDATVDIPQGETVVAVFHAGTRTAVARAAVDAATALAQVLAPAGPHESAAGIGIASATPTDGDGDQVGQALNAAALLQAAAEGRILIDHELASALDGALPLTEVDGVDLPGERTQAFEVRP